MLRILAVLFPPVCLGCSRIEGVTSLPLGLCRECHAELRKPRARTRMSTGRFPTSALDEWLAGWSYEPPFDAIIHGLKFRRLEYLGNDLAAGLQTILVDEKREIDVVVPIPLHWHRRLSRGYNQAEAIARPLARQLGLPLVHALRRRRPTRPQAQLNRRQRDTNLRLAFAIRRRHCATIGARRLLLVDDVVTTGATMEAAARVLIRHGALSVLGVSAGRTPDPKGG